MKRKLLFAATVVLLPIGLLCLNGCSSSSDNFPVVAAPAPPPTPPKAPVFIGSGASASASSGIAHVEGIDYTNRTCLLGWPDGQTVVFKVGPEYVNFDRVKIGDSFMTTVSKTYVAYLMPPGTPPSSITNSVASTQPAGSQPGGVMIETIDYHARVLVINYATRRVVLQYGKDQAMDVQAGPDVNLRAVDVNDDILIRATVAIAITVTPPGT
jgi:hypothetical protein